MEPLNPWRIHPLNEVFDEERLTDIAASMAADGWVGAPIVAISDGYYNDYRALTGSHRIAAAREVGLDEIPVALIRRDWLTPAQEEELDEIGDTLSYMIAIDRFIAEGAPIPGEIAHLLTTEADKEM